LVVVHRERACGCLTELNQKSRLVHPLLSFFYGRAGFGVPGEAEQGAALKVRMRERPLEHEMDGVKLDRLTPGKVCDVSPSLGSWLLAQGYAYLEMRTSTFTFEERGPSSVKSGLRHSVADRRRRRDR
jgi:hypothetical protein